MIRKQHNPVALIPCAILGVSLLAGCATKGYVNKNIEEVRQEHRTDVEGIKTEVAALSNSTRDALARAKTAMGDCANEALFNRIQWGMIKGPGRPYPRSASDPRALLDMGIEIRTP